MNAARQLALPLLLLGAWLAACYGVRYGVMENAHWVEVCDGKNIVAMCDVRATLGRMIHFRVLAWAALACAIPAFFIEGVIGRRLAWLGLFVTAPALVLYTVTPAVFSGLISALRLVREERQSESDNSSETPAQPSA